MPCLKTESHSAIKNFPSFVQTEWFNMMLAKSTLDLIPNQLNTVNAITHRLLEIHYIILTSISKTPRLSLH
jgi:hypothetical protein